MSQRIKTLVFGIALCCALASSAPAQKVNRAVPPLESQTGLPEDVVPRLRAELSRRVKEEKLKLPAHFLLLYAYQGAFNRAHESHTFGCVVRVNRNGTQNWTTISWLPAHFAETEEICVFRNVFQAIWHEITGSSDCAPQPGRNFSLEQTFAWAREGNRTVGIWGPYRIAEDAYLRGVRRKKELDKGKIMYIADDRSYRREGTAVNCMHAITDITTELTRSGGILGTGYRRWGIEGTRHTLAHLYSHGRELFYDPVDPNRFRRFRRESLFARRLSRP